jgi:hypothetical protein
MGLLSPSDLRQGVNGGTKVTLEQQLARLAELGLPLDEGVTVEDLLFSFDRPSYEQRPFDLVLFVLGIEIEREPWGRPVCPRAWNFDTECIAQPGDYVEIVERLCRVAGRPGLLGDVRDHVDLEGGEGWIEYGPQGSRRRVEVAVDEDWADLHALGCIMEEIEEEDRRFYYADNGQAVVLYSLEPRAAEELGRLAPTPLAPVRGAF